MSGPPPARATSAMRTVVASRFTLEPLWAAHAEAMYRVLADPALYAHEGAPPASAAALAERYARLASRRSPDGREQWLSWVVRLPGGGLAGYVQATVYAEGLAMVAYVLGSAHWGRGLGTAVTAAMLDELVAHHGARRFVAVAKRANVRSLRLLRRLGFAEAPPAAFAMLAVPPDETLLTRDAAPAARRACHA